MKQSVDLDVKNYITDNFEALRYYTLGNIKGDWVSYEKAIELDSTFAWACWFYALSLHNAPRGQLEAKHYIAIAMQHRKKLSFDYQILTMLINYQIEGEWDKAEQLIKLQLELEPNNTNIIYNALYFYLNTGQLEKLYALQKSFYERFPTVNNKISLLYSTLRKGAAETVEKETKKLLKEFPQNLDVLLLLAEAYIHQQQYDAARATVEQMLIIYPEAEMPLSSLLDAIAYMKANPDFVNTLTAFEGTFRAQEYEEIAELRISNKGIWVRTENGFGIYIYPAGKDILSGADIFNCYPTEYLRNDVGEIYGTRLRECSNYTNHYWKQDSLIWQAEELLRARDYQQSLAAYETSIARHPEHFYLYDAKKHIEYMQSKTDEEIQQLYQSYVGDYGEVRVWIEDGQLFFKIPGEARRILRPVSDTEFMNLYAYELKYVFELKNGRVQGISTLKYDNEAKQWRKDDTLYYARTKLAD